MRKTKINNIKRKMNKIIPMKKKNQIRDQNTDLNILKIGKSN